MNAYFQEVCECLVQFHDLSLEEAVKRCEKVAKDINDTHVHPFNLACDLAGNQLFLENHQLQYEFLRNTLQLKREERLRNAHIRMFRRYDDLLETYSPKPDLKGDTLPHLKWMCQEMIRNLEKPFYPMDKASRWLGFIQGILVAKNLISVIEERDFSRPLFEGAYGFKPEEL